MLRICQVTSLAGCHTQLIYPQNCSSEKSRRPPPTNVKEILTTNVHVVNVLDMAVQVMTMSNIHGLEVSGSADNGSLLLNFKVEVTL